MVVQQLPGYKPLCYMKETLYLYRIFCIVYRSFLEVRIRRS